MEDDLAWGCGHTMHCTDHVSQKCTSEACMVLLTNVTPINVIKHEWLQDGKGIEGPGEKDEGVKFQLAVIKQSQIYKTQHSECSQ